MNGKVVATDCSDTAPALYYADNIEIVPRIDDPFYMNVLIDICKRHTINGILSLIDPELSLLAANKERFEEIGVQIIMCDREVVETCFDKYATYDILSEKGVRVIPTYLTIEDVILALEKKEIAFPLHVKPRKGSASIGIKQIQHLEELQSFLANNQDYIIQPYMSGSEYCVECYVDLHTGEIADLFSKRKINMRAGETDKSVVVKDKELHAIVAKISTELALKGPVDFDFFQTKEGYYLSEMNPRFGGGYPYAYEMGHNFIEKILLNLQGQANEPYEPYTGSYEEGDTMVRFDQFVVLKKEKVC